MADVNGRSFLLLITVGVLPSLSAHAQAVIEDPGEPEEIAAGEVIAAPPIVRVSGYVDVGGAFAENGGRGFIFDTQDAFASRYPDVAWILLGDPWATPVNSRGDPADTSGSLAFLHDPVDSNGAFTFLVNEVNLDFSSSPLPSLFVFASLDLMPRTGFRGTLGDHFEIDYGYVDWTPFETWDITLSAGRFDSVFGREYRLQESPDRPGIAPSLLFRYVGGHPIGVKGRGRFLDKRLTVALGVLNGASFIESMHFSDDVDRTSLKTASGRLSYALPLFGAGTAELGVSGEAGPQARQSDDSLIHWQWGFDVLVELPRLELRGEFVRGIAPGGGIDDADSLNYRAFFAEGFFRVLPAIGVLARYEQRHATHRRTDEFVYLIHIHRAVAGVRYDPAPNVAVKAEYLLNLELEPLPSFPDNVALASLVVSF